jgi:hypothetical protein
MGFDKVGVAGLMLMVRHIEGRRKDWEVEDGGISKEWTSSSPGASTDSVR